MKIKIIAIIHFAPTSNSNDLGAIDLGNGKFTRFYDSFQFWYYMLGYNLMERFANDINFEIWQPDEKIEETLIKINDNGLVYKLIPGKFENEYTLKGIKKRLNSKIILDSLENEIRNNKNLVLFFRGTREYMLNKIVNRYYKRVQFLGMFSIHISDKLKIDQFYKNPIIESYYFLFGLLPYKRFLRKVENVVPSTQNDLRSNPFFKKLRVFYREDVSSWGIDTDFWSRNNNFNHLAIKEKFSLKVGEKILLISSRVVKEKQVKEIILALGNFKEERFRLIITGRNEDNPYSIEVKELINKLLPGKVILTGYVSDETLHDIYSITDVMLSFSISEGGPFSIFQAYLMEVPVIQSSVGIASEIALQYKISRLVDPNSNNELPMALSDFFKGNKPKILDRQIAADYFAWSRVAEYYYNVFQEVLKNDLK